MTKTNLISTVSQPIRVDVVFVFVGPVRVGDVNVVRERASII